MGVKIQELVLRFPIEISQLAGKIIAIDGPNIIFSLFTFSYKNQEYNFSNLITDRTQRAISHLYGILYRINFYYSKKIIPLFCFDGKVSELKRIITKDQLHDFRIIKQWYKDSIKHKKIEKARKIALGKEFLWLNIIEESKHLLHALGVPYIESPASAESQCAYLVKNNIADYTNTQDFDALIFGCPFIIQNLSKSLKRKVQGKWIYKKISPLLIELSSTLKSLNLDQFQLVDLAILLGTDYNSGVKKIGPKTALSFIKKYQSLENVIAHEKSRYDFNHLNSMKIEEIRRIFLFPEVLEVMNNLYWDVPNREKIRELLCEDHKLNKERVENNIEKVIENHSKCITYLRDLKSQSRYIQRTLDMNF
ncbi:MAG: hypothetical protein EU532_04800 [Promethearchaeota archaeon]|nr:MAG: hypothetical protein EU532_04800 [Candidatus Lokiarchaeota archaeon]